MRFVSSLVCLLILLPLFSPVQAGTCDNLFEVAGKLSYVGLPPERTDDIWNRSEREQRYLKAAAQAVELLTSAPRHFYRMVAMLSSLASPQARLNVNPLVRALSRIEIESLWHQTGLDLVSKLMQKIHPHWHKTVMENASPELKDLLSYAVLSIPLIDPAILFGQPDAERSDAVLEIMMRQQGVDAERVQSLLDHSQTFRDVFAIDTGNLIYQKFHGREGTGKELHLLRRMLDSLLDTRISPPQVPPDQIQIVDYFKNYFNLSKHQRFPHMRMEFIMEAMRYLKDKFVDQKGLPRDNQGRIEAPHALSLSLLQFLDEDEINGPDQFFFQFSCVMTQIIPAAWPARTEVEALMLKGLTEQIHSL